MDLQALVPGTRAFDGAVDCYRQVWGRDGSAAFRKHTDYPGYRGFAAVEDEEVVGYAYGYTTAPGQYYHEALRAVLPPPIYHRWLTDCFELVELGVAPNAREQGIGTRLHEALLTGLPHATSVLTTGVDNDPARTLYETSGWQALFEPFDPEGNEPMVVYGRSLYPDSAEPAANDAHDAGAFGVGPLDDDRAHRRDAD